MYKPSTLRGTFHIARHQPRVFRIKGSGAALGMCISNLFPGDAECHCPKENHCFLKTGKGC